MKKRSLVPDSRGVHFSFITILLVLSLAFDFRYQIMNHFSVLLAGRYDAFIEISILEHWYNVFRGIEPWHTSSYFYPYSGTVAYNDGYIIYGMIYSIPRYFGVDPYLTSEIVSIVMRAVGLVSFYFLMRRVFLLGFEWSAFGAVLFSVSNNISLHEVHQQLLTVGLVPLLAVSLHESLVALLENAGRRFVAWGLGTAALLGLWLMTGFYMAWFALYFSLFLAIPLLWFAGVDLRNASIRAVRRQWKAVALVVIFIALALLPFAALYLPKARSTGMWPFAEPDYYALTPLDIIHVGAGNLVWGGFDRWLNDWLRPGFPPFSEHTVGFPPLLLIVFLAGIWLAWRRPEFGANRSVGLVAAVAIAVVTSWVFVFRLGDLHPWHLIFNIVPGAKALRAISRYQIFLAVPVTAIAVATLARHGARLGNPALLAICSLLIAEEVTDYQPLMSLNRTSESAFLAAVPAAPGTCTAFFVSVPRGGDGDANDNALYSHNVDAMMISEIRGLPTINGFSTFKPPDWDLVYDDPADYLKRVKDYAARHRLQGLCGLDLQGFRWSAPAFAAND